MCGRFTLKTPPEQWGQLLLPMAELASQLPAFQPRYNIAPTQDILAIAKCGESNALQLQSFRWGLVPGWASELSIGNRVINARSESLLEKRSFQGPLKQRRCLILADGYYEWEKLDDGSKQPFWISPAEGGVIQLAGLWDSNQRATGQKVQSCTIITTAANSSLAWVHDRMPVMLAGESARRWMDSACDAVEAHALLGPAEDGFFKTTAVSKHVNNPRHEDPACLQP